MRSSLSSGSAFGSLPCAVALVALVACGGGGAGTGGSGGSGGGAGGGGAGGSASGGAGGAGGGASDLDQVLARLRADFDLARLELSDERGFPLPIDTVDGVRYLVVTDDPSVPSVAGDFDAWAGQALTVDQGFSWGLVSMAPGEGYKLTDGATFAADPWSRAYRYDGFGELSLVHPSAGAPAHLERLFGVAGGGLEPRTVRVWVPAEAPTRVLYVHDGQNLFDPDAFFGGWKLGESAPPAMLLVGIDNTPARMDEYTHVEDVIGGQTMGGLGDAYATLLEEQVRPRVVAHWGEPPVAGLMGSSLGGLISLHVADRQPDRWAFAASLSGTMGWGSIGDGVHNETLIERLGAKAPAPYVVYIDSGGGGVTCADSDGDGIDDDDLEADDNYCENVQLRDELVGAGWVLDQNLFHWHEPGATHDEAAWAARVFRPLDIFAAL